MNGPDKWDAASLVWERAAEAIGESRRRGWEWRGTPAGSAEPEVLVGRWTTSTHDDVVVIEVLKHPARALGARFASGDWGKPGTRPLRGPVDGTLDVVLSQVLGWPEDVA
ncbi:hypothetical protein [Amycolatopsis sp. lyj-346]|uniref:hypothetical protein n=1 Tax=Amycolatopsis sp. lyj-346 TaxID=2789289 RepID=UPI00397B3A37